MLGRGGRSLQHLSPCLDRFDAGRSASLVRIAHLLTVAHTCIRSFSLAALLLVASGCSTSDEQAEPRSLIADVDGEIYRFVIPNGTGELLDQGETVDLMPDRLDLNVGDAVEIVNEDDRSHKIGLFFVRSGETVTQVFPTVAEFSDDCDISESGVFTISIT